MTIALFFFAVLAGDVPSAWWSDGLVVTKTRAVPVAVVKTVTKTKTLAAAVTPVDGVALTAPPDGCVCTDEGEARVCPAGECECASCPTRSPAAASCVNGSCQVRMTTSSETKVRVKERPAKVGKFKLFKRKARGRGSCCS